MKDLIERMEKATGPDRELNKAIYLHIGATPPDWGELYWTSPDRCTRHYESVVPHFTSSIDAAMTLVPDGWWWSAGDCRREKHASVGSEFGTLPGEVVADGFGATVAIALCIAALRARADGVKG